MKKLHLIFLILLTGFLFGTEFKNIDKPDKGEWDFKLSKAWETSEAGKDILARIRGIEIDNKGNVFIWESKQLKIFVYNSEGKFLYSFGKKGEGPGEIMDQWGSSLFLSKDHIILHERNTGRINYFQYNGTFYKTIKLLKLKYSHAMRGYIDSDNLLFFLSDTISNRKENFVGVFNLKERKSKKITDYIEDKPLVINDKAVGNMTLYNPIISVFMISSQIEGDKVVYGRNNIYKISILDLKTNKINFFSISGREGKVLSLKAKEKMFSSFDKQKRMKRLLIEKCPDRSTLFNKIEIGNNGLIYIFLPQLGDKGSYELDIFSPTGKYLYHAMISIPSEYSNVRNLTFHKESVFCSAEDEEGEVKLIKFNIKSPYI